MERQTILLSIYKYHTDIIMNTFFVFRIYIADIDFGLAKIVGDEVISLTPCGTPICVGMYLSIFSQWPIRHYSIRFDRCT